MNKKKKNRKQWYLPFLFDYSGYLTRWVWQHICLTTEKRVFIWTRSDQTLSCHQLVCCKRYKKKNWNIIDWLLYVIDQWVTFICFH
jgi:hypothetical protein